MVILKKCHFQECMTSIFFLKFLLDLVFIRIIVLCQFSFPYTAKWIYHTNTLLFSHSVMSDSLRPHGLQHARLSSPSPNPGACSNACALSRWWHPIILSSVIPLHSYLPSFLASGSFLMSQLFTSSQSTEASVSASVFPMNIQGWFPLELTGWISLQSKGLSRIFSSATVQEHQYFSAQPSL